MADGAPRAVAKRIRAEGEGDKDGRADDEERHDDSDSDQGPSLPSAPAAAGAARKKRRGVEFEKVYLANLPNAEMYEKSYMHRDTVTHVAACKQTGFLVTGSVDGHIKFWKKMPGGVEFVKHYKAHLGPMTCMASSRDGTLLCTGSEDKTVKFYDVASYDMVSMAQVDFVPHACCWVRNTDSNKQLAAVADRATGTVRIFDPEKAEEGVVEFRGHSHPVCALDYSPSLDLVVSADLRGMIEYWRPKTLAFPADACSFRFKMDTDLFDLAKNKEEPASVAVAPRGDRFAVMSRKGTVRLFRLASGRLARTYDETLARYDALQKEGKLSIDSLDYGRRAALERERLGSVSAPPCNVAFDESGTLLLYSTMLGVKVVNTRTNAVRCVLGRVENTERFLSLALYQGIPRVSSQLRRVAAGAIAGGSADKEEVPDPTLVCCAYKRQRLFLFSRREPDEEDPAGRDVFNEKPTAAEAAAAVDTGTSGRVAREAIMRTTKGDIYIKLYADECPRTVENFTVHSRNGYYDGVIFHRVIKDFMVQTGDPEGTGMGGESIWGGTFEDEFDRSLRHDRPFTVSMANAGPSTNGSQFFITTRETPWLDEKHTVFGRVTRGKDVIMEIANAKTRANDRPHDDIKILNIDAK